MKLNKQQRLYKLYRAACKVSNVEPVFADYMAGDIPECVQHEMWLGMRREMRMPDAT